MNKSFQIFRKKGSVLFKPKLGELLGIHSLHQEESARGRECLERDYIWFLHKGLQIIMSKTVPES